MEKKRKRITGVTLEESDEDILLHHGSSLGVLDVVIDLCVLHEDVTASGTEENLLEEKEALAQNYASDKTELHTSLSTFLSNSRCIFFAQEIFLTGLKGKSEGERPSWGEDFT